MLRTAIPSILTAFLSVPLFAADDVDFTRDIRPILSNHCYACHGPDAAKRKGGLKSKGRLRLDTRDGAIADHDGFFAIKPGNPSQSEIIERAVTKDEDERMPPKGKGRQLTAKEIDLLRRWIKAGAPYAKHWSYTRIEKPDLPKIKKPSWARQPIDHFVLAKLETNNLKPAPEAEQIELARRVALDLTGLPPTIKQVDAFVADKSPEAYEKYVDGMLASPAYGERWGRVWLDLARYADSAGYADDPPRTIWAYRDWVINAINANMPYDRFTIEQIAGDMLPNATDSQKQATAFHRNTLTNSEGGTNDEEFRNVAVVDRINTTMQVWMGTTFTCAQCHTHKYDPITQEEYFKFFDIFNQSADADKKNESPTMRIRIGPPADTKPIEAKIATVKKKMAGTGGKKPDAATTKKLKAELGKLQKQIKGLQAKGTTTVPIMQELPANRRRKTHVQLRGNFLDKGKLVTAGVPSAFHPLPAGAKPDRLAVARWLVSRDNPLTGRVTVNRYWEQLFGTGLVRTSEEFGNQGELPSHPKLLDWMAADLMENGWDIKRLLRQIVTSATYRQSSKMDAAAADRDPDNRMLSRGPRFRLSAEMVRDQALFVSGLLSRKMNGPSVNPPRPKLGLRAAFGGSTDWNTSKGEDKYRRGLYTSWRRSRPYPSMDTFDAPSREVCTVRRISTNTPLQALVTLNDPVYVEASQALARRMVSDGGKKSAQRIVHGFRLCLARKPSTAEAASLNKLYTRAKAIYAADAAAAKPMATDPLGPLPAGMNTADLAAWTVVANVLINLDEMFMKR